MFRVPLLTATVSVVNQITVQSHLRGFPNELMLRLKAADDKGSTEAVLVNFETNRLFRFESAERNIEGLSCKMCIWSKPSFPRVR